MKKRFASYSALIPALLLALCTQAQIITTIAGNDTAAYAGDGGLAIAAKLFSPVGVAIDDSGNVYIADQNNNRIRKIYALTDTIITIAGDSAQGFTYNNLPATFSSLYAPSAVALDAAHNIYIADQNNNQIRKVAATNNYITTIAGTGNPGFSGDGGLATAAQLNFPSSLAIDDAGNVYIADYYNNRVRMITASSGIITTIAGNTNLGDTVWGYSGDGGPATAAEYNSINAVTVDHSGNVYLVDAGNNCIRKITAFTGIVQTIAGNGNSGYSGDGDTATKATLNSPDGIALDASGNIYISDAGNNVVRTVNVSTGTISTLAGNGIAGFSGDGGAASSAELYNPAGMAFDPRGNLYIADELNSRIRKITSLTGINELSSSLEVIKAYPVPSNGNLRVELGGEGYRSLSIFDELGQLVYQQTLNAMQENQNLNINISNVPNGIYYLQALGQKSTLSKSIVIQK